MKPKHKLFENWRSGVAGAAVSVLLGWTFLIFSVGESLTNLSYDIPFAFRRIVTPDEVVIVRMDEESHSVLNQHRFDLWDRSLHAQLIGKLRPAGARAVVFDILFDTTNQPSADRELVKAVKAHGGVAVAAVVADFIFNRQRNGTEPVKPFPALLDVVATWGMVETSDGSRAVGRHYQGEFGIPSLAWRVAGLTLTHPPAPDEPRWMNYYGPPGTIPHESYHRVLSNAVPAEVFSNKVVYVGADFRVPHSGGKGFDDFRTPYTRWAPHPRSSGVEINATTYLNLVRGDWLRRPSPAMELLVLLLTGIAAGYGLSQLRPLAAAGVGTLAALSVAFVGCLMPWLFLWWYPWMIVVAVQLPAAVIGSTVFGLQRIHESWRALQEATAAAPPGGPVPAGLPAAVGATPMASGAMTSEVLQQMMRLRGTSGISPGVLSPSSVAEAASAPTVPDHQLLRCVGRGAYGEVWLARNVMGRYRAAKIVYRKNFREERPYEREFEGIRRFEPISRSHPGLVQILHVGRDDAAGCYYYLMEAADDSEQAQEIVPESYSPKTLSKVINRHVQPDIAECLGLAESLTQALDYLHGRGLIHRDIKPSNIIFVNGEPKLADVGLVTDIGDKKTFVGTAGYFPPEGPGTPSADLYSLGKVLYELVTGLELGRYPELPTSFNVREQARELSELNNVILKACEVDPRRRYQSAKEMHLDLQRVLQRRPGWLGWRRR